MKLLAKFNLILLVVFGVGGLIISQLAHSWLQDDAKQKVTDQAKLMLASSKSIRDYVGDRVSPILVPLEQTRFLPESIPFFAANSTFNYLRKSYPDYTYLETALNPTNPADRPADWERDIINELRDHPSETELSNVRPTSMGPSLYIAHPIHAMRDCLQCHGSLSAAPKSMLDLYGSANGFGWKLGDVIGAQIVSIPMSVPIEEANHAWLQLLLFLIGVMIVAILALDAAVYWFVIRPLKLVSETADRVSRGEKDVNPVRVTSKDEIATVASSFNRMQVSLAKALKMVEED
jgi:methyl-accepting chemotaxis protein